MSTTEAVSCSTTGSVTDIKTGNDQSGISAAVNRSDELTVEFLQISDIDGFTGSYWRNLGPAPTVKMTGGTYEMIGSATGFTSGNPSARTTEKFFVKVAC